jgi:predicted DNA binding protein
LLADLPRLIGGGIVGSMPSNRTQQQTADLFRASDQSTTTEESPERRQPQEPNVALTRGQVNAVRAAFKAGITPSRIARQFGISQSDVRKVLASESRRAGKGR